MGWRPRRRNFTDIGQIVKEGSSLLWLDVRELADYPERVRHEVGDVADLAASIERHGVLQPLGVARRDGRYAVVFGARRRQAAARAGLRSVPCVEVDQPDPLVCQLLENVLRAELNDLEKARGFAALKEHLFRLHPDAGDSRLTDLAASEVGLSSRTVRRYLALLALPPEVQSLIATGDLSVTQAQHLIGVGENEKRIDLAELTVERGLSAAQVSRAVAILAARPGLPAADAVDLAERGEEAGKAVAAARAAPMQSARLAPRPTVEVAESDDDFWPDDEVDEDDDDAPHSIAALDPATRDGNRIYRVASVDSFCDEVARITRAVQDGDLRKALANDDQGTIKLGLALRQLRFVVRSLEEITS
jgi:ParB family transcriptional regulator, chromosome partitioning protein